MPEKSVAIVGAGIAGLAAGCYGRLAGRQALQLLCHADGRPFVATEE